MQILLTNDDGFHAPGINALDKELQRLGDVTRVAPATEQSGVGHSITFLRPLVCQKIFDGDRFAGWAVEGSPADCVKLGVFELCPEKPQLVVSGINGGLNAGINVLYSGTVAAAIEGAFFGITSVAVSLEYDEHAQFDQAAVVATRIIEQVLGQKGPRPQLYNLNLPTIAMKRSGRLRVVPMGVNRYGEHFIKRTDPKGRSYYWATDDPPPDLTEHETDLSALARGDMTLTPLDYDLSKTAEIERMRQWDLRPGG